MMPSQQFHHPYAAVSTDIGATLHKSEQTGWPTTATGRTSVRQRPRWANHKFNYKPVPLRAAFLVSFVGLFIGCIALVELLLRNSVTLESYTSTSTTSPSSSLVPRHLEPTQRLTSVSIIHQRDDTTNDGRPTTYICPEGQPTPTNDITGGQPRASLCSEFSATFASQTKNLSYPLQSSLSQFLLKYNEASHAGWNYGWSSDCPTTNAFGTFYRTVDMLCELATFTVGYNACMGLGTAYIEGLALVRTSMSICGITRNTVIDETAKPSNTASDDLTSQISVTDVIDPGATPIPTVTVPADSEPVSPAGVAAAGTPTPTDTASMGKGNQVEPTAQPSVENVVVAVASVPVTLVATNALGEVQTIVTQVDPVAATASPTTVVITDGQGLVSTMTTQIAAGVAGVSATIVTTDAQGIAETVVVAADQLVATTSTSLVTNAQGQVATSTKVDYILAGEFATHTATNSDGQVQTIISKIADSESEYTTVTQYTSMITTTNADGSVSSFSAAIVQTVVLTGTPTVTATRTSTVNPKATGFVLAADERIVDEKYSSTIYILAMYLPALIAVIIKAMWEMVFAGIKLMEPFERMAAETETGAQESIFSQYLSSSFSLDAFSSVTHGNPLPLLAGFLYVVVQVFTPLAAASMTIRARDTCNVNGQEVRCLPTWIVNVTLLRAVEIILGLCAVIVLLVLWNVHRRRSGVQSDPSSLAAIAALMTYEPLLRDIRKVDPCADHSLFEAQFVNRRFHLGYHTNSNEQHVYGIISVPENSSMPEKYPITLPELDIASERTAYSYDNSRIRYKHNYQTVHNSQSAYRNSSYGSTTITSRIRKHLVADICGFVFPVSLLTIILVFYFDEDDTAFNRFFNSDSIVPKIILVTLATLTSLHLSHLERLVRIAEPFRRLAAAVPGGPKPKVVPPETTFLLPRSGTPYSTFPTNTALCTKHIFRPYRGGGRPALFAGGMFFQFLMSLTVIIADFNILAVAGVTYNDAMTWSSYQWSAKISIALTGWIVLMYAILVLWWRRNEAIRYVAGRSISKGVGTVGGLMRWLASGQSDGEHDYEEKEGVVGAILRAREETRWGKSSEKMGMDQYLEHGNLQYQGAGDCIGDGASTGRTVVWFGRTGIEGPDGRDVWALMCHQQGVRKRHPRTPPPPPPQQQQHAQAWWQEEDTRDWVSMNWQRQSAGRLRDVHQYQRPHPPQSHGFQQPYQYQQTYDHQQQHIRRPSAVSQASSESAETLHETRWKAHDPRWF